MTATSTSGHMIYVTKCCLGTIDSLAEAPLTPLPRLCLLPFGVDGGLQEALPLVPPDQPLETSIIRGSLVTGEGRGHSWGTGKQATAAQ